MPENNRPLHRKPSDMQTWEIIAAYRHAYQIMSFCPNAQLARALANFMGSAQESWRGAARGRRTTPRAPETRAAECKWKHRAPRARLHVRGSRVHRAPALTRPPGAIVHVYGPSRAPAR